MARGAPGPLTSEVLLRDMTEGDLPYSPRSKLTRTQTAAAFTARDPADWDTFTARWTGILGDETITKRPYYSTGMWPGIS